MLTFGIWVLFTIFCLLLLYAPECFSTTFSRGVSFASILLGNIAGLVALFKMIGKKMAEEFSNNTFIVWSSGVKGYHLSLKDFAPELALLLCSAITVFIAIKIYIKSITPENKIS